MRLAINGFGRIGRAACKILHDHPELELVAVNDLTDASTLAYLLQHDTVYGRFAADVQAKADYLLINGHRVPVLAEKDPSALPWKKMRVDVVLECTGRYTDPDQAAAHLKAGASRVVISAPAKSDGASTFVVGVNHDQLKKTDLIVSNASCTTNCIAPVMAILEQAFGIRKSLMTTVHAYTASQVLQDGPAKDLREARAAAENIVPTSTGAAKATALVMPSLKGLFDGLSIRVPVPIVSLSDITALLHKPVTVETVNTAFSNAIKQKRWQGIVEMTNDPIVSSDCIGNPASAIVDLSLTRVVDGDLIKVVAWYDNEWGYANRLVELAQAVGSLI